MFDRDGGGSIDAVEIQEMVKGLFAMAGVRNKVTLKINVTLFFFRLRLGRKSCLTVLRTSWRL